MKKSKFTEAQIVFALRQSDIGTIVAEVCRKMGISEATFITEKRSTAVWAFPNFGDFVNSNRTAEAEENQQLKQLVADLSMDKQILQDVIKKKL